MVLWRSFWVFVVHNHNNTSVMVEKHTQIELLCHPRPYACHELGSTVIILVFHYGEGKQEQLVVCINPYGDQRRTSVFTVQMSATDDDHRAATLEAFDGGSNYRKTCWNWLDLAIGPSSKRHTTTVLGFSQDNTFIYGAYMV